MTEIGEGIFVNPPEKDRKEDESIEEITLRLMLYFDGTLNNRTNIDERLNDSDIYQEHKDVGSYNNAKSNVALLEANVLEESEDFDYVVSIYTEGAGTEDYEKDRMRGYAIGTGPTGIKAKVEKGVSEAINRISRELSSQSGQFIIKEIAIDLVGFSRGAASARYCIHYLMDSSQETLEEKLETQEFEVDTVDINFVGLFDTVSSHGLSFSNDVRTLKLDAIRRANQVVQLEASEEYRENFSLTSIKSAGAKGIRICLPGAHSDVGGGYRSGEEAQTVFRGHHTDRREDKDWLIEKGWYREHEIELVSSRSPYRQEIAVRRKYVSNSYSKIPLDIMATNLTKHGAKLDKEIEKLTDISAETEELNELKALIDQRIEAGQTSTRSIWTKPDPLLNIIRNRYLHMSARYGDTGMAPRMVNGQRTRKVYEG